MIALDHLRFFSPSTVITNRVYDRERCSATPQKGDTDTTANIAPVSKRARAKRIRKKVAIYFISSLVYVPGTVIDIASWILGAAVLTFLALIN